MAKKKTAATEPKSKPKSGPAIYTVPLVLGDKELLLEFNFISPHFHEQGTSCYRPGLLRAKINVLLQIK